LGEDPYAERIGIGLENTSNRSFTPLLSQVEELVQNNAEREANLGLLAGFAEFDKRQATRWDLKN
jgi:hypothetical protein